MSLSLACPSLSACDITYVNLLSWCTCIAHVYIDNTGEMSMHLVDYIIFPAGRVLKSVPADMQISKSHMRDTGIWEVSHEMAPMLILVHACILPWSTGLVGQNPVTYLL